MRTTKRTRMLCGALALAAAVLDSGCATQESRYAAYEKALSPWQGATEETLLARWGRPMAEQPTDSGKWLVYVVNNGAAPTSTMSFSLGGFGYGGGHSAVGGGVGVTTPVGVPTADTCTTRFLVENGKVSTWTFEGPGCGAGGY